MSHRISPPLVPTGVRRHFDPVPGGHRAAPRSSGAVRLGPRPRCGLAGPRYQSGRYRRPWVARSLLDALTAARDLVYPQLHEVTALKAMLPWSVPEAEATVSLMGSDFWPYGIEPNRKTLETFLRYSHEQGLAKRVLSPEELFVPETHEATLI